MGGISISSSADTIDFERRYPKLYPSDELIFTTLRKDNEENYKRFNGKEGKYFRVTIQDQFVWTAMLVLVTRINATDLNISFLRYDTDYDEDVMRDITWSGIDYLLLIFKRLLPQKQLEALQ